MTKNRLIILLITLNLALIAIFTAQQFNLTPINLISRAEAIPTSGMPSTAAQRRTELTDAAAKFSPSVVSVGASRTAYYVSPYASFFSDFTIFKDKQKIPYLGSGVIVDPDGLIVTNYHVVENMKDVFVTLSDGRELPGKVLDADTALDVALIKVDAKNLPAARLGDSNSLLVGEWVLAMGNPFGNLIGDPTPTVTAGVVSAVKRNFRPSTELKRVYQNMIQTDAAINPGNSGGALINSAGELVGINTFIMSRSGGAEGIGFAIPVNRVKSVIDEIVKHGHIRSRLMDFQVQNLSPRLAKMLETSAKTGAVVTQVADSGPAAAAGIKVGDVITKVNGQTVADDQDLQIKVWTNQVGSHVQLTIDRAGQPVTTNYELMEPKGDDNGTKAVDTGETSDNGS